MRWNENTWRCGANAAIRLRLSSTNTSTILLPGIFWTSSCAAFTARRCMSPKCPLFAPTWCCGHCPLTVAGTISAGPENTSLWDGARPRNTWTRSKPSLHRKAHPMNQRLLRTQWHQLPEKIIRQLQAEKLRRYLRDVVVPFSAHYRELFARHGL